MNYYFYNALYNPINVLLCASEFQNYLRTQTGNNTTVNIIISTVDYLLRLQVTRWFQKSEYSFIWMSGNTWFTARHRSFVYSLIGWILWAVPPPGVGQWLLLVLLGKRCYWCARATQLLQSHWSFQTSLQHTHRIHTGRSGLMRCACVHCEL